MRRFSASSTWPQEIPDTLASPLPGGVSTVVRFFFQVPQWLQIGGAIVGVLVAGVVAMLLWRRRKAIFTWVRMRPKPVLAAMAAGVALLAIAGAAFGMVSWNYMMHDNEFCVGCHVMNPSYTQFSESEHATLNCHDCHQQPMTASMRQLYLWVLERPEEIGPHAGVPNQVCARCHIQEDPDSTWQRISATAGHQVHLESDSSTLAGLQCIKCHGVEVHRFVPPDQTCGQSGCHEPVNTQIRLGSMADQTSAHCAACHNFTVAASEQGLPATATAREAASARMVPTDLECTGCHEMGELMASFDADRDPHLGVCGTCHNPHEQTTPEESWNTCGTAGCHERVDTLTAFHRGIHATVREECGTCHKAHTWEVAGTDCRACHTVLR